MGLLPCDGVASSRLETYFLKGVCPERATPRKKGIFGCKIPGKTALLGAERAKSLESTFGRRANIIPGKNSASGCREGKERAKSLEKQYFSGINCVNSYSFWTSKN